MVIHYIYVRVDGYWNIKRSRGTKKRNAHFSLFYFKRETGIYLEPHFAFDLIKSLTVQ